MRLLFLIGFLFSGSAVLADTVIATRTIRPNSLIGPGDVTLSATSQAEDALQNMSDAIGKEAKVILYAGRPISSADLGSPTLIGRNEPVVLIFRTATLSIATEGRSLGRAGAGDRLRVLNLSSRNTVDGIVDTQGRVIVGDLTRYEVLME